jgi:hypothetical protein
MTTGHARWASGRGGGGGGGVAEDHYSWETQAAALVALYGELLG